MHVSESRAPDEPGELDEDIEEAVEEGLHGVAEALAHGHEREQEVAAAGGRQVRQRRRHHRRAVPGGAAAPVHELQLLQHAHTHERRRSKRRKPSRAEQLRFRVLRSFRGRGGRGRRASTLQVSRERKPRRRTRGWSPAARGGEAVVLAIAVGLML